MARGMKMRSNGEGRPVVALDIDGTLGDYHRHFLSFAENWFGREMPPPGQFNPGLRLHKFMGVRLVDYRQCKLAYRQGGLKRWMPVYEGAAELTAECKRAGAEVWICTTRPYLRLDNIDPDTREWLRRSRIRHDAVLFGEDKYRELRRQAGKRVAAIVEDLPELWQEANRLFPTWKGVWEGTGEPVNIPPGPSIYLRDQPYNRHINPPVRLLDFGPDARAEIISAIRRWKERNQCRTR